MGRGQFAGRHSINSAYRLLLARDGTVIGRSLIPEVTRVKYGRWLLGTTIWMSRWTRSEATSCNTESTGPKWRAMCSSIASAASGSPSAAGSHAC
jgi:hypothetical protein